MNKQIKSLLEELVSSGDCGLAVADDCQFYQLDPITLSSSFEIAIKDEELLSLSRLESVVNTWCTTGLPSAKTVNLTKEQSELEELCQHLERIFTYESR